MAFFHLITHAGFKALLFLCAGFYMFTSRGAQDIRLISVYGGPAAIVLINVSNLALCGIPFMSGFYSKDRIVDYLFVLGVNPLVVLTILFSCALTVSYSLRLVASVNSGGRHLWGVMGDGDFLMLFTMGGLGVYSVVGGACLSWLVIEAPCTMGGPEKLAIFFMVVLGGFFRQGPGVLLYFTSSM